MNPTEYKELVDSCVGYLGTWLDAVPITVNSDGGIVLTNDFGDTPVEVPFITMEQVRNHLNKLGIISDEMPKMIEHLLEIQNLTVYKDGKYFGLTYKKQRTE